MFPNMGRLFATSDDKRSISEQSDSAKKRRDGKHDGPNDKSVKRPALEDISNKKPGLIKLDKSGKVKFIYQNFCSHKRIFLQMIY
jgi:hypothetical protein